VCDQKYIHKSFDKVATTQHFSCFSETRQVDFTKNQTRDEVSFYKKLARLNKAAELGMNEAEYAKLLRVAKTGRFDIVYNEVKKTNKKN